MRIFGGDPAACVSYERAFGEKDDPAGVPVRARSEPGAARALGEERRGVQVRLQLGSRGVEAAVRADREAASTRRSEEAAGRTEERRGAVAVRGERAHRPVRVERLERRVRTVLSEREGRGAEIRVPTVQAEGRARLGAPVRGDA